MRRRDSRSRAKRPPRTDRSADAERKRPVSFPRPMVTKRSSLSQYGIGDIIALSKTTLFSPSCTSIVIFNTHTHKRACATCMLNFIIYIVFHCPQRYCAGKAVPFLPTRLPFGLTRSYQRWYATRKLLLLLFNFFFIHCQTFIIAINNNNIKKVKYFNSRAPRTVPPRVGRPTNGPRISRTALITSEY